MELKTVFNEHIVPQNDFLLDKTDDEFVVANKTKLWGKEKDVIAVFKKTTEDQDILQVYAHLLNLTKYGENLFIELNKNGGEIENNAKFEKLFCIKYKISRPTYIRALNELTARGIVKKAYPKIYLYDKYYIKDDIHGKKVLVMLL